jgi:hypothetical protein
MLPWGGNSQSEIALKEITERELMESVEDQIL